MQQLNTINEVLDYIVQTSIKGYSQGFRESNITFNNKPLEFFGSMISFASMELSFEYKGLFFRACRTTEGVKLSFAPKKDMLFDETWCIELPITIYSLCYIVNK